MGTHHDYRKLVLVVASEPRETYWVRRQVIPGWDLNIEVSARLDERDQMLVKHGLNWVAGEDFVVEWDCETIFELLWTGKQSACSHTSSKVPG